MGVPRWSTDGTFVPSDGSDRLGVARDAFRAAAATIGDRGQTLVPVDERFPKLGGGSRDLPNSFGKLSPEVS